MSTDLVTLAGRPAASTPGPGDASTKDRAALMRVAQQFEAMLLTQMLREMRETGRWDDEEGKDAGGMGLGLGGDAFMDAMNTELANQLAATKSLGVAAQMMASFERMSPGARSNGAFAPTETAAPSVPVTTTPPVAPTADPVGEVGGTVAPVASTVTSAFGWRSDPFTGQAKFHKGIDLRAAYGQDVQAAATGRVVFAGDQRGYGTTVVIEHADGTRSRYAHLSATTVVEGARVDAGQVVGRAGRSGRATGTHLHFEVNSPEGRPIAPSEWMQRHAESGRA